EVDDVFVTDFFHKDVGQNSKSFLLTETTRWLRLKGCDHMSSVRDFIHGNTQLASHLFITFGFQVIQIIAYDSGRQTVSELKALQLNQETFPQITRRNSYRIKELNAL